MNAAEFRRCLADLDIAGIKRLWKHVSPHLPQPATDHEALATLHMARTGAASVPFKLRAYSHRWLTDNGLPSSLPDPLKPKAERIYPRVAEAVGIAVGFRSALLKPLIPVVRGAMEDAVSEAYADGRTEPAFVRGRMFEAKDRALRLAGITDKGLAEARASVKRRP